MVEDVALVSGHVGREGFDVDFGYVLYVPVRGENMMLLVMMIIFLVSSTGDGRWGMGYLQTADTRHHHIAIRSRRGGGSKLT